MNKTTRLLAGGFGVAAAILSVAVGTAAADDIYGNANDNDLVGTVGADDDW